MREHDRGKATVQKVEGTVRGTGGLGWLRASRAEPIGLLAGSGRFPILFAAARRQGLPVACVGIRYEASE